MAAWFCPQAASFSRARRTTLPAGASATTSTPMGFSSAEPGSAFMSAASRRTSPTARTVNPDGTLAELKPFAQRGGESVAVDTRGNVYVANGQIFVYSPDGQADRGDRRAGAAAATDLRRRGSPNALHPCASRAIRGAGALTVPCFLTQARMILPRKLVPDHEVNAGDKGAVLSTQDATGLSEVRDKTVG